MIYYDFNVFLFSFYHIYYYIPIFTIFFECLKTNMFERMDL